MSDTNNQAATQASPIDDEVVLRAVFKNTEGDFVAVEFSGKDRHVVARRISASLHAFAGMPTVFIEAMPCSVFDLANAHVEAMELIEELCSAGDDAKAVVKAYKKLREFFAKQNEPNPAH